MEKRVRFVGIAAEAAGGWRRREVVEVRFLAVAGWQWVCRLWSLVMFLGYKAEFSRLK